MDLVTQPHVLAFLASLPLWLVFEETEESVGAFRMPCSMRCRSERWFGNVHAMSFRAVRHLDIPTPASHSSFRESHLPKHAAVIFETHLPSSRSRCPANILVSAALVDCDEARIPAPFALVRSYAG